MLGVISIFKSEEIYKRNSSSFLEKEQRRLAELDHLNLIHTPDEKSFDQITNLASRLFQTPISLITFITKEKQWFKSSVGLIGGLNRERFVDRSAAFCQYVVADGNPLVVEDTLTDERFKDNSFMKELNIRFYAGVPIITKNNNVLGSLCIIDTKPRSFTAEELKLLIDLSNWVHSKIELKADLIEKTVSEKSIRSLYEVTSNNEIGFREKLRNILALGCERFHFIYGVVSEVKGKQYEIIEVKGESEDSIKIGDIIPLTEECKSKIEDTLEPFHGKVMSDQTCIVNKMSIDEYIIAPIFVQKQFYGTLCFFSHQPSGRIVSCSDLEFLQLMSQWIGNELERIQAETELMHSQKLFQQISNNIKEAFWMYDINEAKLLYTSSACQSIYGMTSEEFNNNPTMWFHIIHPDDIEKAIKCFENINESKELDIRLLLVNGSVRWVRHRIVPIPDKNRTIYRIVGVAEDITEQKINEDLLRKSDKLAAVSQLAASIAHEIRNPLTSIKGFMQFIKDLQFPYHELLLSEFTQIEDFINEILMLANPHHEIKFVQKDLSKLLFDVINVFEGRVFQAPIKYSNKRSEERLAIFCDENQIKLVFQNLLDNAIEAMPDGGTVTIETGMENEQYVYATFEDQGIGISDERLAKLGEPFYSNKEKGSGLGLMISYKIIQNHNGKIEFTSQLQKGTKVKILLPLRIAEN